MISAFEGYGNTFEVEPVCMNTYRTYKHAVTYLRYMVIVISISTHSASGDLLGPGGDVMERDAAHFV
jgi:hypothetical protein